MEKAVAGKPRWLSHINCVYIDSQRTDQPHFVAGIQNFKLTKRDQLNVLIKWYYRPCEIPETVYRTLVQDRHTDNIRINDAAKINDSTGVGCSSICLKDPIVQSRELFISDAVDTYPVSAL
uniref:BAH domain-containing protein n=1 Tax=Romanomermis culicivorax TaxID=13658 RepID=A0A915HZW2_ROMCU